jgi:hypothetical protein
MSTRATIRFAERKSGQSFAEQPKEWYAQFYKHHDGYPEGLGVDIAKSFINQTNLRLSVYLKSNTVICVSYVIMSIQQIGIVYL